MFTALCATCVAAVLNYGAEPVPDESIVTPPLEEPAFATPTRRDRIGRIIAPVMINGQGPYRMLVDTGASRSTMSPELVEALGLKTTPDRVVLLNGVTGSAVVPFVTVDRMQAGDFVLEGSEVPVLYAPLMTDADGILGVAAFRNERVVVDFEKDRIEISKAYRRHSLRYGASIPARRVVGGLLAIDARIGGVRARAIIDTGAERSLGNLALRDALQKRRRHSSDALKTRIVGATPDILSAETAYAPTITLGPVIVTDVAVFYGDFHVFKVWGMEKKPVLLIGMDVLGTLGQLSIDYRAQEVRVRTRDGRLAARD